MPWGARLGWRTRNRSRFIFVIAAAVALGVWAQSTMRRADPGTRVLGTTIWTGSQTFPSGYTVTPGQTVELNPSANTTVELGGNLIVQGTLRSWPVAGVVHTIKFTGINESAFVGGGGVPLASDKGLWVTGAGRLDMVGAAKLAWTRASGTLAKGATGVTLESAPTGWRPGDEILISPTENPGVTGFSTHHEVRTITNISGSTISFAALSFPHPKVTVKPGTSHGAEIVNLTRNVRIEGQDANHRTHVWLKSGVPQTIRYAAIRYVGPQKGSPPAAVLGRYGLHFHQMDNGSRGSLVEGVVVRKTGGVAFAAHRSHGVTFRNTVAFDVQDTAYWYDAGASEAPHDTVYDRALAAYVQPTPAQDGYRLTAFRLGRGTGNACLRCVAFGVQGAKNASGFEWPESDTGVWRFEDSLAHNNKRNGIFVWQNNTGGHVINRFTSYHNGYGGIEHGAYTNEYHYIDNILYGNKAAGIILHSESQQGMPVSSFEQTHVDGAGITVNAVNLAKPTLVDNPPTIWCGATILGLTGPAYYLSYSGPDSTLAERLTIKPTC